MTRSTGKGDASQSETIPTADTLCRSADMLGIPLGAASGDSVVQHWLTHLEQLYVWNRRFNLTAIRDPRTGLVRHLLEALVALDLVRKEIADGGVTTIVDVGSGNGYPGLPLVAAFPAAKGLLVEASARKADFLRAICRVTGLSSRVTVDSRRIGALDQIDVENSCLVFRGIPDPSQWLHEAARDERFKMSIAWLSKSAALEIQADLEHEGHSADVRPLPTLESGALLISHA